MTARDLAVKLADCMILARERELEEIRAKGGLAEYAKWDTGKARAMIIGYTKTVRRECLDRVDDYLESIEPCEGLDSEALRAAIMGEE